GEDLGGHRLAGAALAGEERADPEPAIHPAPEAPVLVDTDTLADLRRDLTQHRHLGRRQDEAVPVRLRVHALGEHVAPRATSRAGRTRPGARRPSRPRTASRPRGPPPGYRGPPPRPDGPGRPGDRQPGAPPRGGPRATAGVARTSSASSLRPP